MEARTIRRTGCPLLRCSFAAPDHLRTLALRLAGPCGPKAPAAIPGVRSRAPACSPAARLAEEGEVFASGSVRAQRGTSLRLPDSPFSQA